MRHKVGITFRKTEYIVEAFNQVPDGFWTADDKFFVIDLNDKEGLHKALLDAKSISRQLTENPPRDRRYAVQEYFKVKSYGALIRGASYISISFQDGKMRFLPTKNEGGRGGFAHLPDKAFIVPFDEATLLENIEKCFALCE